MKVLGSILIIIGIVALVYGGFTYTRQRKVLDVGPIEARTTERHTVPISPIVGGICLVAGIVMVAADRERPRV
jgi:uncharacterized membrane protein YidH (DUF202 family)